MGSRPEDQDPQGNQRGIREHCQVKQQKSTIISPRLTLFFKLILFPFQIKGGALEGDADEADVFLLDDCGRDRRV